LLVEAVFVPGGHHGATRNGRSGLAPARNGGHWNREASQPACDQRSSGSEDPGEPNIETVMRLGRILDRENLKLDAKTDPGFRRYQQSQAKSEVIQLSCRSIARKLSPNAIAATCPCSPVCHRRLSAGAAQRQCQAIHNETSNYPHPYWLGSHSDDGNVHREILVTNEPRRRSQRDSS